MFDLLAAVSNIFRVYRDKINIFYSRLLAVVVVVAAAAAVVVVAAVAVVVVVVAVVVFRGRR